MNPLIDEYFKRDLTESEEKDLAEDLAASPEDALRLAQGLEDLYAKSGLPAPVWPGGTMPPFGNHPGWIKPLIPSLLILLLAGFSAYQWFRSIPPPAEAPREEAPMKKIHALNQAAEKILKRVPAAPGAGPVLPAQPLSATTLELPSLRTEPASPAPPFPQPQGHLYQQLSIVVEPTSPSLATVRVLDGANHELKTLFAGIIPAGRRTFTWDGKTTQGTVAPAGTYFIEVKSGEKVMRQEVKVEGN